jgi:hypothetical protein
MYYGEKFNALTHLAGALHVLGGTVVPVVLLRRKAAIRGR